MPKNFAQLMAETKPQTGAAGSRIKPETTARNSHMQTPDIPTAENKTHRES